MLHSAMLTLPIHSKQSMSRQIQEKKVLELLTTSSIKTLLFIPQYCGLSTLVPNNKSSQMVVEMGFGLPLNPLLINVTNIILQNVKSEGGWLNAGVLRCAASNPCRGIILENVTVTGWASSFYTCENVQGKVVDSTPIPSCVQFDRSV